MPAIIIPTRLAHTNVNGPPSFSAGVSGGEFRITSPYAKAARPQSASANINGTEKGIAYRLTSGSLQGWKSDFPDSESVTQFGQYTVIAFFYRHSQNSSTPVIYAERPNATQIFKLSFKGSPATELTFVTRNAGNTGLINLPSTGVHVNNTGENFVAFVKTSDSLRTVYANGSYADVTTSSGGTYNPSLQTLLYDPQEPAENNTTDSVYYVATIPAALSIAELHRLNSKPWSLLQRASRILYFPSAGGGATDIAGALESISLSTFGATVGSARAVAAALESLALTTSAARVSSDRAITASVESISITTSPARIASDRAVAAATEQLTVTPATASVALVSGIAAGTEALSVTANPATVALAASIAATLEAITVTGLTATVSTSSNTNISAALESITVTVNPATVSRNTALAAALESLTVTPHAASIAVGQIVAAALESLTLTSYPAGIALDVAIAAQLEQINLTTLAAQVGLGTNVAALTEALTLTPHGATLTFAPSVGAATEYITLTTFAAVVGATEAALLSPGLEFTIPLSRLGYTIPLSRVHFTIPQE